MAGKDVTKRRRIVLAAGAVLIAGIGYGVLKVVLFATGKPMISADYAAQYNEQVRPANYDPNDDAALDYREAFALLPAIPDGVNPLGHLWEYDPASAEYKTLESWLTSCEPAIGLLHKAAAKPYFWGRVSSGEPNIPLLLENFDFGMFGQAAHCLRYRTEYLAAHGNMAEALRCIVTGLRMGGQLNPAGRQCLSMGQIMEMVTHGAAFDLLAHANVDPNLLGDTQNQLEEVLVARAAPSFRSDGIVLRDIIQRCFTDEGKDQGHVLFHTLRHHLRDRKTPKSELGANLAYLRHFWIAWSHPNRRETIQTVDRLAEAATQFIRQTPWELHTQEVDYVNRLADIAGENAFLRIAAAEGTLAWAIENHYRSLTSIEALIATMGILRFHQDKGIWPASLEDLAAAGYIRRIPLDPYSGKPLVYAQADSSFLLYSYGKDLHDNGGIRAAGSQSADGGDLVFWPIMEHKK
jgi:hypothetical protein